MVPRALTMVAGELLAMATRTMSSARGCRLVPEAAVVERLADEVHATGNKTTPAW